MDVDKLPIRCAVSFSLPTLGVKIMVAGLWETVETLAMSETTEEEIVIFHKRHPFVKSEPESVQNAFAYRFVRSETEQAFPFAVLVRRECRKEFFPAIEAVQSRVGGDGPSIRITVHDSPDNHIRA